jgi:outer membrane receptor protein involved in Fe transport
LRQTGPKGLNRTFYRPKGSVSAAWKASRRLNVNARLERQVGQLQFSNFLASVNVIGGNENAGNPELVPPQSWIAEVEGTRNFGAFGSTKLRLYAQLVTDIVDQIPIGASGESPGNLDSAKIYGLELASTVKFDPLGWKGAKLDLNLRLQDSEVRDPLTLLYRPISVSLKRRIDLRFRHDVPDSDWAWGTSFLEQVNYDNFRLSELSNLYNPANVQVFVEHKDVAGLKVRASVGNVFGINERYRRAVYVNRRNGPLAFLEQRNRAYGPIIQLSISGSL